MARVSTLHRTYEPARACTDGPAPGAREFMAWFLGRYAQLGGTNLGIYNCRTVRGGSTTSLHGEGRAVDFGVRPLSAEWGWVLARLLVAHSKALGVQCVIWDRRIWSGSHADAGFRVYGGSHPHTDHLHVELSRAAAQALTAARVHTVLGGSATTGDDDMPTAREIADAILDTQIVRQGNAIPEQLRGGRTSLRNEVAWLTNGMIHAPWDAAGAGGRVRAQLDALATAVPDELRRLREQLAAVEGRLTAALGQLDRPGSISGGLRGDVDVRHELRAALADLGPIRATLEPITNGR